MSLPAPSPVPEQKSFLKSTGFKVMIGVALLLAFIAGIARMDLRRDLRRLKVSVASGSPEGNYHALVDKLAAIAADQSGHVSNVASQGSLDNIRKLSMASTKCDVQYGLVQDGSDWAPGLELIGRLPRAESVILLGKEADKIPGFSGLNHLKIGIGPDGSGDARLAHQIFDSQDFTQLQVNLSHHELAEQIDLAAKGQLDLAMFVMDEDAPLIRDAIRERGLQMVGFPHAEVLARRLPFLKAGRVYAGQYDAVKMLPPDDKRLLRVETLVVANTCPNRSQTIQLMTALSQMFPDFVRHNRDDVNVTGLQLASAARTYFEHQGPEWADEYVPWLEDLMPLGNWVYVVTGISVLFNAMGFGNRFRLWRIDADRVKLELELDTYFPLGTSVFDIEHLSPSAEQRSPEAMAGIKRVADQLQALSHRSRKQSLSILVPMGQEMAYRYQENVIYETVAALRIFLRRCEEPNRTS